MSGRHGIALLAGFLWHALLGAQIWVHAPVRMLALGDSYTIGQSVPQSARWPVQFRDSMAAQGVAWDTIDFIASTGWRTDQLISAMNQRNLDSNYNLVSLLIGVNNQFQGRDTATYALEFAQLLGTAIELAGGDRRKVMVLSIPDYAYTPYGQSSNPSAISAGIDQFNAINQRITRQMGVTYVNITPISRAGLSRPALVAGDGLHPSGLQYSEWVSLLLDSVKVIFPTGIPADVDSKLMILPNPASTHVTIISPSWGRFCIRDQQGKVLLYAKGKSISISTAGWPKGIYVVEWSGDNQRLTEILLRQ